MTVSGILKMVERIRRRSGIPLIFMTYANVVFSHGTERFVKDMAGAGLDGLILPDVPFEEREEFSEPCKQNGIVFPPLIAPTSRERISRIAEAAEGFVYCVSSLGVTGMRSRLSSDIRGMVQAVKKKKDIPCAIGFGISTPEQAREMAGYRRRGDRRERHCEAVRRISRTMHSVCFGLCAADGLGCSEHTQIKTKDVVFLPGRMGDRYKLPRQTLFVILFFD